MKRNFVFSCANFQCNYLKHWNNSFRVFIWVKFVSIHQVGYAEERSMGTWAHLAYRYNLREVIVRGTLQDKETAAQEYTKNPISCNLWNIIKKSCFQEHLTNDINDQIYGKSEITGVCKHRVSTSFFMFANTRLHVNSQHHDVMSTLIVIQCDSLCANCQLLKTGLVDHTDVLVHR